MKKPILISVLILLFPISVFSQAYKSIRFGDTITNIKYKTIPLAGTAAPDANNITTYYLWPSDSLLKIDDNVKFDDASVECLSNKVMSIKLAYKWSLRNEIASYLTFKYGQPKNGDCYTLWKQPNLLIESKCDSTHEKQFIVFSYIPLLKDLSRNKSKWRKIYLKEPVVCFEDKDKFNPTMMPIHGDSVLVTKNKEGDWNAEFNGKVYYHIDEYSLPPILEEKTRIEREKQRTDSIVRRKYLIKKYGVKMGVFISARYIKIGMTKAMARDSWGEPQEIHRTAIRGSMHEQWVYGINSYLYFENGILTGWQD